MKKQLQLIIGTIVVVSGSLVWLSKVPLWESTSDESVWPILRTRIDLFGERSPSGQSSSRAPHFLVSSDGTMVEAHGSSKPLGQEHNSYETVAPIYFTPDDDVRKMLLQLINEEQERISLAIFAFTDRALAKALIDAHQRGVRVEIVTDPASLRDTRNRITELSDSGIPVFIYQVNNTKTGLGSSMHHKFMLFKRSSDGNSYVWTGSCNFTRSGFESNQENAVILTGSSVVRKFGGQFSRLKRRSRLYGITQAAL